MPRQIVEKYPWFAPLAAPMVACERRAIRGARAVVAVCEYLAAIAREAGARRVTVLRDVPLNAAAGASAAAPDPLPGASPRFLYVGNLEAYQGVDLMLDAFTCHVRAGGQGSLVIVGGGDALPAYRGRVAARGLSARVRMPGPRPLAALAATLRQADILVSPRIRGGNTPMKIYSYLASERPVLATRIAAHTEVMDDTMGVLCEPTVPAMAAAMRGLADDPARRRNLGARAARIAREQFSPEAYRRILLACYDELAAPDKEGVVE